MNDSALSSARFAPGIDDALVALVALTLDFLRQLDRLELLVVLAVVSAVAYQQAASLQSRWTAAIATTGGQAGSLSRLELELTLPGLLLRLVTWPFRASYRLVRFLWRKISAWLHRRGEEKPRASGSSSAMAEGSAELDGVPGEPPIVDPRAVEPPVPEPVVPGPVAPAPAYLAATLGPSFLLAALGSAGLYLLSLLGAPAMASSLDLPSAASGVWELVLLGTRPELGGLLPLGSYPQVAVLAAAALWLPVWSTLARLIRLGYRRSLGRNLIEERDRQETLEIWRRGFAARRLVAPSAAYRQWAVPMVSAAVLGLGAGWFFLDGGGLRPTDFVIAWITCLSWVIHLRLRGEECFPATAPEEVPPTPETAGWNAVLADLLDRLQVQEPWPAEAPRPVESLVVASAEPVGSPLLAELLTNVPGMSAMQHEEIEHLSRADAWQMPPSAGGGVLSLEQRSLGEGGGSISSERESHRIVLAPEGWGKTTLAFLAAVNHPLLFARTTLIVVRGADEARRFENRFRPRLEGSTLRWNVSLRRLGGDLSVDLAQGIVPDCLLCDLHTLVVDLLADPERHVRFLRRVGLVVVDDADLFAGPVEVHAQLAFRRLRVALRRARGMAETGAESDPRFLVLSRETMHRTDRWIRDLCGVKATVGHYGTEASRARERRAGEEPGASDPPARAGAGGQDPGAEAGHHQRLYRLRDFKTPYGEALLLPQLIASCERLAVPWHYRRCGAGGSSTRSHGLGDPSAAEGPQNIGILDLPEQPAWAVAVGDACVVFLAGSWSEVRREIRQLRRAGSRFSRFRGGPVQGAEPIALIADVDGDEDMALTTRDSGSSLRSWIERLPLPILRPPGGEVVATHLAADLLQGWSEVGDLVQVYGHGIGGILRQLDTNERLLAESRIEVAAASRLAYEERLFVRVLDAGAAGEGASAGNAAASSALPPRVGQVELPSVRSTTVVDRATQLPLSTIDAAAAHLAFYPGRIFATANGRYVVAETESWETPALAGDATTGVPSGFAGPEHLWADPILLPEVSSPRRRIRVTPEPAGRAADGSGAGPGASGGPEPVFFGAFPLAVALLRGEVASEHFVTLRVDRASGDIRQKHVIRPGEGRRASWSLSTEVLHVYPVFLDEATSGGPPLDLPGARLIASAMRLVLPSLYRGGADALAVGLDLAVQHPTSEHVLGPRDSFVFYDLGSSGTGAARALRRDGLELLLRLVRLVLERVLSHRRLLALYDEWADAEDLWNAESRNEESQGEDRSSVEAPEATAAEVDLVAGARGELERRRSALTWLDSRLRPEGGPPVLAGHGVYGWDSEPGEGDLFDLGRCWYSCDGPVSDLLWVKHRWRLPAGGEGALDIGFDRSTVEASRWLTEDTARLEVYSEIYRRQLATAPVDPADGRSSAAPRPVWIAPAGEASPEASRDPEGVEAIGGYHVLAAAVAAHGREALGPLARKLQQECGEESPLARSTWVAHFVQGIPFSLPLALGQGLRPPVGTLLFRRGDCDSKSLLLALLLEGCGLEAGLMVSFAAGHAVAAVAIPGERLAAETDSEALALEAWRRLQVWSETVGLAEPPTIWALAPSREDPAQLGIFVPVESTIYAPVGASSPEHPQTWAFLPLAPFDTQPRSGRVSASDRAEEETLS